MGDLEHSVIYSVCRHARFHSRFSQPCPRHPVRHRSPLRGMASGRSRRARCSGDCMCVPLRSPHRIYAARIHPPAMVSAVCRLISSQEEEAVLESSALAVRASRAQRPYTRLEGRELFSNAIRAVIKLV